MRGVINLVVFFFFIVFLEISYSQSGVTNLTTETFTTDLTDEFQTTNIPQHNKSRTASCNVPSTNKCHYVAIHTDECEGGGYIQYNEWVHCSSAFAVALIICIILMIEFFIGLSVSADSYLCPCIAVIVDHLKINENMAGVTIMALGNGAPDIFGSVAAVLGSTTPKAELSFGALLGSGIFLNTVIVGTVCVTQPFYVMRRPTIRDFSFYLFALVWAAISMFDGAIRLWNSLGFLVLYVLYVFVVVFGRYMNNRMRRKSEENDESNSNDNGESENNTTPPILVLEIDADYLSRDTIETEISMTPQDLFESISPPNSPASRQRTESRPILTKKNSLDFEADWAWDVFEQNNAITSVPHVMEEDPVEGHEIKELLKEVYLNIKPFTKEKWKRSKWYQKIALILWVPVVFILKISNPVVNLEQENNGWSKAMMMVHCILCPLIILIAAEGIDYMIAGVFPLFIIFIICGAAAALLVYFKTERGKIPKFHTVMAYIGFIVAVAWIYALAREVVGVLTMLAAYTHLPHSILGLTLMAWSNSLGDLVCDLTVARQGFPQMAVSACYGGALFNLLVSIGLSFTIAHFKNGHDSLFDFTISLKLLLIFLLFIFIISFIRYVITKFHASRPYGIFLLCVYALFIICVILARFGILDFLNFD